MEEKTHLCLLDFVLAPVGDAARGNCEAGLVLQPAR